MKVSSHKVSYDILKEFPMLPNDRQETAELPEGAEDAWLYYELRTVIRDHKIRYGLPKTQIEVASILYDLGAGRPEMRIGAEPTERPHQ